MMPEFPPRIEEKKFYTYYSVQYSHPNMTPKIYGEFPISQTF